METDAHADCEALMNFVLPFARQRLSTHGSFAPFGAGMRPDGKLVPAGGHDGTKHPSGSDIMGLIKAGFVAAAKSGDFKATALVVAGKFTLSATGEKTDAIAIWLDHRDEYSVMVIQPYKIEGGKLLLGKIGSQKGAAEIFPAK